MRRRRVLLEAIKNNIRQLTEEETLNNQRAGQAAAMNSAPVQVPVTTMTLGPLTIFPGRYQIQVGDQSLNLTPTEFDLLLYLAAHRGRVVPCYELVREVRGYTVDEAEAREVIRPHISNLRRKLERAGQDPDLIVNVRGVGYRLSEPMVS
jgi:DNA-binding response OmpR family regulator